MGALLPPPVRTLSYYYSYAGSPLFTAADASALAARVRTGDERAFPHPLRRLLSHPLCLRQNPNQLPRTRGRVRPRCLRRLVGAASNNPNRARRARLSLRRRSLPRVQRPAATIASYSAQTAIAMQATKPSAWAPQTHPPPRPSNSPNSAAPWRAPSPHCHPRAAPALLLRVTHGLDYAEIGATMGISPQAAMIHVSRARSALRPLFDEFFRPE